MATPQIMDKNALLKLPGLRRAGIFSFIAELGRQEPKSNKLKN